MSNLVTTNKKKISDLLEKMKGQLALCLPKHMSAERMCRIAMTEFSKNPKLQECDPMSFIASVMVASQLGLEIGIMGSAYLVPRWNSKRKCLECNLVPGYRGLLDLARRSDKISTISAEIVYEHDEFYHEKGLEKKLIHKPTLKNKGDMIATYAVAKLRDGNNEFIVMTKEEIDQVKERALSNNGRKSGDAVYQGPWETDYNAMAQKTVIRRIVKWLPSSVEMQKAAILDEHNEAGIQDIKSFVDEEIGITEIENSMQIEKQETQQPKLTQAQQLAQSI